MGGRHVRQGGRRQRGASTGWPGGACPGDSVAGGAGGRGSGAARVGRPSYRGLAQLCHASVSGLELRDCGFVMLGDLWWWWGEEVFNPPTSKVQETFELNQLNPPLHNFYWFFQELTGCKFVAIKLDMPISYFLFFFECRLISSSF